MGKTRDLFKKIRDTNGTFHAKMGSTKDKNGMDLTEAEEIKKRWQKYTEELYKRDFHDSDNHNCVISHLEPDILECEVKWALGNITTSKASGGDGISIQFISSVTQLCLTLCDPMNCRTPGLPVHHQLLEFTQTHVHRVDNAIQPSHPLSSPSPRGPIPPSIRIFLNESALNIREPKVLEFQLQHQSFQ